ncbi:MAG: DUF3857 domain-containing protein, partial [Candidatus Krumholzibacteria bacterium]|nr:DUF3857 domain-containing protein [Candidatus Krumholzibacteria bacterium]
MRQHQLKAEQYPDAEAVVLLDEERRICFADGANYRDTALAIKILTAEGVETFSSMNTGVNPYYGDFDVKAMRTVKPDGREIEAEQAGGWVAFKSLEPGDIIELHYGSSTWRMSDLNRDFWDSHIFRWTVPCLASRYVLLVPPTAEFDWRLKNYDGDVNSVLKMTRMPEFDKYVWEMTDVEAVRDEPLLPPWSDGVPWLDVSSLKNWQEINDWYVKLSTAPSRPDPVVAEKVQELIADQHGKDQQIRALYNFVCNEVTYENLIFQYSAFVPNSARRVLQSMYGDCKDKVCLLRSMLSEVGVESHFVLVTPLDFGKTLYLPSPRFNHTILAIPVDESWSESDGEYWFLDPTAQWMPVTDLPWSLKGARG